MIRTVLVDDHQLFCDGLEKLLVDTGNFKVIRKFNRGLSFLENFNKLKFDLVILDLEMSDINGFDVVKSINKLSPSPKKVILSMHEATVYSKEARILGVDCYITKSVESTFLIDSISKVCFNNEKVFSNEYVPIVQNGIFSRQEINILRLMSNGKTSKEIGEELAISNLTVKAHKRNMMKKLDVKNSVELMKNVFELGIL